MCLFRRFLYASKDINTLFIFDYGNIFYSKTPHRFITKKKKYLYTSSSTMGYNRIVNKVSSKGLPPWLL